MFMQGGHTCGDHIDLVDGQPVGAVRVSLGYMSTTSDVDRFVEFLRQCFLQVGKYTAVMTCVVL